MEGGRGSTDVERGACGASKARAARRGLADRAGPAGPAFLAVPSVPCRVGGRIAGVYFKLRRWIVGPVRPAAPADGGGGGGMSGEVMPIADGAGRPRPRRTRTCACSSSGSRAGTCRRPATPGPSCSPSSLPAAGRSAASAPPPRPRRPRPEALERRRCDGAERGGCDTGLGRARAPAVRVRLSLVSSPPASAHRARHAATGVRRAEHSCLCLF